MGLPSDGQRSHQPLEMMLSASETHHRHADKPNSFSRAALLGM